jgi:hypothetical protein
VEYSLELVEQTSTSVPLVAGTAQSTPFDGAGLPASGANNETPGHAPFYHGNGGMMEGVPSRWTHVQGLGWLESSELTARAAAATGPRGLDYSAAPIPGSAIRKAGYDFVIRYVDDPALGLRPKHCRAAEYADLVAAGLDVWLVFEQAVTDMLGGYGAGVANARRAQAGARALGHQGLIFMASDMHLTAAQIPVALQYIRGAESVLGHGATGVYGFWELIDAAITAGVGSAYWQAGIAPAPTDPVHLWQRNDGFVTVGGIQCDVNVLLRPIPGGGELPDPEEEPMLNINQGEWPAGAQQRHTLTCPVGPQFLAKHGYLTLTVGWEDATLHEVVFIGDSRSYFPSGISEATLSFDTPRPIAIPEGTHAISVEFTSDNPVGWCAELFS